MVHQDFAYVGRADTVVREMSRRLLFQPSRQRRGLSLRGIRTLRALALLGVFAAAACGGGDSLPTPAASPPRITIEGIEAGAEYDAPVRITVRVEPADAAFSVELNGARFTSGSTVSSPGDYFLSVEASRAGLMAEANVAFRIVLTGERKLILRLFDLGPDALGGGGDAILVTDSSAVGMVHGLVDAGPRGERGRPLDDQWVLTRLRALGVERLAFVQLTHAHADHFGGMVPILQGLPVERFVYNGQVRSFSDYQRVLAAAGQRADSVRVITEPWTFTLGSGEGATETLHIPGLPSYLTQNTNDGRLINEGSLGTLIEGGGVRIFLTGDGEDEANARWRTAFRNVTRDVDILKVGHHGANNAIFDDRTGVSQTSTWLEHTRPTLMLVSSNGVSHPRTRALNRMLGVQGAQAYCTHVHGEITVRIAGGAWTVDVERNADRACVPGSEAST
jgi:beta-lactamase superfamily II metal-dependent hydrolase